MTGGLGIIGTYAGGEGGYLVLPIRDNIRSRGRPVMTYLILLTNVVVFLYQLSLPWEQLLELFTVYGIVPARIESPLILLFPSEWGVLVSLFTSQFLHGGVLHLGGNMLYLWIFGDNVECSMGSLRFLLFYLLTGAIGGLGHVLANPESLIPTIGASGAIAGILGAYFVSFPQARVLALVPLGFFLTALEIPAPIFLLVWFLLQLLSGVAGLGGVETVAWWAHIGGFIGGMVLIFWFRRTRHSYHQTCALPRFSRRGR